MGPKGVILEKEAHVALVGRNVDAFFLGEHALIVEVDFALGGGFQAGDHAQGGGFSAAGGAQEGYEIPVLDDQIKLVHRS